jgi:hypothetical protein
MNNTMHIALSCNEEGINAARVAITHRNEPLNCTIIHAHLSHSTVSKFRSKYFVTKM